MSAMLIAAAARPHPHETENGDAWAAFPRGSGQRIVVVDGLGHGPDASAAARAALVAMEQSLGHDLPEALRRCHEALLTTRGAAMGAADVDPHAGHATYAGVGNIEARLWHAADPRRVERPISYRGIIGSSLPKLRTFQLPLGPGWRLILHTDGISARFDLTDLPAAGDPQALADAILAEWSRPTDDATIVIAAES